MWITIGANQGDKFLLFKNGSIVGYNNIYFGLGDNVKIIPNNIGIATLSIISDEPGCVNWAENNTATNALPVSWLNQPVVKLHTRQTNITWSVTFQINNEKYIIEHCKDGRNFSPNGQIAGDGTSNETKHYEYTHTSPSIGMNYYRIKQVDYDGKYSYSNIASVRYDGDSNIIIYPNPTSSEVTITTTEQTTLQIMDVNGRLLNKQDISEGQNTINLSQLPTVILIFVVGNQRYKVLVG